jgi:hypothetical protein
MTNRWAFLAASAGKGKRADCGWIAYCAPQQFRGR